MMEDGTLDSWTNRTIKGFLDRLRTARRREPHPGNPDQIPEGLERLPIPGYGGKAFIQYPKDLTAAQLEIISSAVQMLRLSVQARDKAGLSGC